MPGPRIEEVSRARLARDALRFGFLGAMLLYTFLPAALRLGDDPLALRRVWPGAWAGALAGATSVLGGILYSAGPVWRSTFRPPHRLVDLHFYATALGSIAVFGGIMMATTGSGSDRRAPETPTGLSLTGGGLLLVASVVFVLNAVLAARSHRGVHSADT